MGLLSFLKNAGTKLFGGESAEEKSAKVKAHLDQFGLDTSLITITVVEDKVTLAGKAKNLDEKQKIVATAGNIEGIAGVDDQLEVIEAVSIVLPDVSKMFYEVKSGDNLSKIAAAVYGNANAYNEIFEANKPMLKDVDKIYPGQMLYIPPKG